MLEFLSMLCLLGLLVSIVCLPFRHIRRRAQWTTLASFAGFIIAFSILSYQDDKARHLGFADAADQRAAEASGFTDSTAWRIVRDANKQAEQEAAAKKEADEAAAAAKKEADEAAAAAKKKADEVAAKAALDHSAEKIKSCDLRALLPIIENMVNVYQGIEICERMRSLAGSVSVGVFRDILKTAFLLSFNGAGTPIRLPIKLPKSLMPGGRIMLISKRLPVQPILFGARTTDPTIGSRRKT